MIRRITTSTMLIAAVLLAGCEDEDPMTILIPPRVAPQTPAEIAFAKQTLNSVQPASIAQDREYCGYIGLSPSGQYVATRADAGRTQRCVADWPDDRVAVIASYHSHGAWSHELDSELPSYDDIVTDITERVDGYVITPGGRMWYIDAEARHARQICGAGCLITDPMYRPDIYDPTQMIYTLQELAQRSGP